MSSDPFHEREVSRLVSQLKRGCQVRVYHHGESPSFVFLPGKPETATQVRHEIAKGLVDQGDLTLVEKGWNFDVYELSARDESAE